jgi:hypothetical protein
VEQIAIPVIPTTISVIALIVAFFAVTLRRRSRRKVTRKKRQPKEVISEA